MCARVCVVTELCYQIERRHSEISEMVRRLLELDAANRAEAAALLRLSEESATSPVTPGPKSGGPADDSGRAAGPDATMSSSGDAPEAARPGVKRRNPFSRAVSAIRRKFARPQQEGIPAAA